jgi:hypothetical protein
MAGGVTTLSNGLGGTEAAIGYRGTHWGMEINGGYAIGMDPNSNEHIWSVGLPAMGRVSVGRFEFEAGGGPVAYFTFGNSSYGFSGVKALARATVAIAGPADLYAQVDGSVAYNSVTGSYALASASVGIQFRLAPRR